MEKKPTKRQHYVPQFYLKRFADEKGFLHIYDIANDKIFKSAPKDFAFEDFLYEIEYQKTPVTGEKYVLVNHIEDIFAKYEAEFADLLCVLDKVCTPKQNPYALICNSKEKKLLCRFIVNLIFRNPYTMTALELHTFPKELNDSEDMTSIRKIIDLLELGDMESIVLAAQLKGAITEEYDNNDVWQLVNNINRLNYMFMYAKNKEFLTSTFPVNIGIDNSIPYKDKTCVYLALSRRLSVMFGDFQDSKEKRNRLALVDDDEIVDYLNVSQFKHIYGNNRCIICSSETLLNEYIENRKGVKI